MHFSCDTREIQDAGESEPSLILLPAKLGGSARLGISNSIYAN